MKNIPMKETERWPWDIQPFMAILHAHDHVWYDRKRGLLDRLEACQTLVHALCRKVEEDYGIRPRTDPCDEVPGPFAHKKGPGDFSQSS